MTRMWTIAFSIWALIGLVAYKPSLIFGFQKIKFGTFATKPAPKPKLRKLAKSYKVKGKHAHLMAKLNRTKKVKSNKGNLEKAFQTLSLASRNQEPIPSQKYNEINFDTPPHLENSVGERPSIAQLNKAESVSFALGAPTESEMLNPPVQAIAPGASSYTIADTIDNEFSDSGYQQDGQSAIVPPEPNDSLWTQDDLMTAFDQININVLQFGADYKSAFQQLSDDVMASATNERLKGQMLDQIQKEYDAYAAYLDGTQITSL